MSTSNPYDPNPYDPLPPAPPPLIDQSDIGQLPPYSVGTAIERGWRIFTENYAVLLGVAGTVVGLNIIDNCVQAMLQMIFDGLQFIWAVPYVLLVTIPLQAGLTLVGARAARGEKCRFADLFLGYSRLGWIILWSLLMGLVCTAALIPGAALVWAGYAAGGQDVAFIVGLPVVLVYLVLFLCIATRFAYVTPMLADPRLPRMDLLATIKASWGLTKGIWPSLLLLGIVVGLIVIGSIFLLCVGVIFLGYPLSIAIGGAAYAMVVMPLARGQTAATG